MKTSEPKPEEILKKYTFGYPAKLWADDAEIAMQEYAEAYHKEKLREELREFIKMVFPDASIVYPIIDKYLKTKE
jgi:hypothetical protein